MYGISLLTNIYMCPYIPHLNTAGMCCNYFENYVFKTFSRFQIFQSNLLI